MSQRDATNALRAAERLLQILLESPALPTPDRALFQEEREKLFCHFTDEVQALTERIGSALKAPAEVGVGETPAPRTYLTAHAGTVPGAIRIALLKTPDLSTYEITRVVQELRPGTPSSRVPTSLKQMMTRHEVERQGSFKNYRYRLKSAPFDASTYAKAEATSPSTFKQTNGATMVK